MPSSSTGRLLDRTAETPCGEGEDDDDDENEVAMSRDGFADDGWSVGDCVVVDAADEWLVEGADEDAEDEAVVLAPDLDALAMSICVCMCCCMSCKRDSRAMVREEWLTLSRLACLDLLSSKLVSSFSLDAESSLREEEGGNEAGGLEAT